MEVSIVAITVAVLLGILANFAYVWALPVYGMVVLIGVGCCVVWISRTGLLCLCLLCGYLYGSYCIQRVWEQALPFELEGINLRIVGKVISLVHEHNDGAHKSMQFLVEEILSNHVWAHPGIVQLSMRNYVGEVLPGQRWLLEVRLKRPRNYSNPGSFDLVKLYFQRRIVAVGYVMPKSESRLLTDIWYSKVIQRFRQRLLGWVLENLHGREFAGAIIGLLLGDQNYLSTEQRLTLQATGTAHLMSISGLHMSLAGLCSFWLWQWVLRYVLGLRAQRTVGPRIAACGGLGAIIWYAQVAGLGVATQRALIMAGMYWLGMLRGRSAGVWHRYCVALLGVLVLDPLVVLSAGFWLSFTAVLLICYLTPLLLRQRNWRNKLLVKIYFNFALTLGLLPVTVYYFAQVSLAAPLANLLAIPWVSIAVVPCCLLVLLIFPLNEWLATGLLHLAEYNFSLLWPLLRLAQKIPVYYWRVPYSLQGVVLVCASVGVVWLLMPRGIANRYLGICGLLPLFFLKPESLQYAQAHFTLLDVGQGLSAVVRTREHVLVYDTGAKVSETFDLGSRVVAPYLRAVGVNKIDTLVISHADNDHIGGMRGLLANIPSAQILTSDVHAVVDYPANACQAGQRWTWDGVEFLVLHPEANAAYKHKNDLSCVLMVTAGAHKLLLTGDIQQLSEQQLMQHYQDDLQSDVMLVPHHGSNTSSSIGFLEYVRPKYALVPAGYKNKYRHPRPNVIARYQQFGIMVLSTIEHGAVSFVLGKSALTYQTHRSQLDYFWLTLSS